MVKESLPSEQFTQPLKYYLVTIRANKAIKANVQHVQYNAITISKYQKEEVLEKIINSRLLKR